MPLRNGLDFIQLEGGTPIPPSTFDATNSALRLVTYNMASGNVGPQWQFSKNSGGDQQELRRHLIETILLESGADVVCVQESVVKANIWGERQNNSRAVAAATNTRSVTEAINKLRQDKILTKAATAVKQQIATSESSNGDDDKINVIPSIPPVFVRSQRTVLTHCGQTFLYYNKNTCQVINEGAINGHDKCPAFPVMAIEKLNSSARHIFLICSVHLAPFPQNIRSRQQQFSYVLSELDRLERVWRLNYLHKQEKTIRTESKNVVIDVDDDDDEVQEIQASWTAGKNASAGAITKIHKIIAGDTNMTNDQFPDPASSRKVLDCWYDFYCQSQSPSAEFFKEKCNWFDTPNVPSECPKFFEKAHTFGGDNDYNQGGMIELRKFQLGKGPFLMRYDRVYLCLNNNNNQSTEKPSPVNNSPVIRVKHMKRIFDERILVKSGPGSELLDYENQRSVKLTLSLRNGNNGKDAVVEVKSLPGRYLSDHFGLLVDFEVGV